MFMLFTALIGTAISVLIRLKIFGPVIQYIADNQLYNSIITAHAIFMLLISFVLLALIYKNTIITFFLHLNTEKIIYIYYLYIYTMCD
jgi:heme/copper-type cytochrome/quinol oxidase subunit 1